MLLVGGCESGDDGTSKASSCGITAWRTLSGQPHYKQVTSYEDDVNPVRAAFIHICCSLFSRQHRADKIAHHSGHAFSLLSFSEAEARFHQAPELQALFPQRGRKGNGGIFSHPLLLKSSSIPQSPDRRAAAAFHTQFSPKRQKPAY